MSIKESMNKDISRYHSSVLHDFFYIGCAFTACGFFMDGSIFIGSALTGVYSGNDQYMPN